MESSSVLITLDFRSRMISLPDFLNPPAPPGAARAAGLVAGLMAPGVEESGGAPPASRRPPGTKPNCAPRISITWFARRLISSKGSWARLAISPASRVRRSAVLIWCFSREGRRCVYVFVGKSGMVCRRSVMEEGEERKTYGVVCEEVGSTVH